MKLLRIYKRFKNWRNIIVFMILTLLMSCSRHMDIYRPIDVSKSGQSVKIDFELSKEGNYQFTLLFETGEGYDEMERRFKFFGRADKDGVIIPVSLHIVKDGEIFFDKKINARGYDGGQVFHYEERRINTAVREIKTFSLPPGSYSVVITTLKNAPAFNGIESFVGFTYYDPKI